MKAAATSYGPQSISGAKNAPGCFVIGEADAPGVTLGSLKTQGDYFTLENVTVDVGSAHGSGWANSGNHVTLKGVRLHGAYVAVDIVGDSVSWIGGELGESGTAGGARDFCGVDDEPLQIHFATNTRIDGITFWPQAASTNPACNHLETVRIDEQTAGVMIANCDFKDGDGSNTARIFITTPTAAAAPTNVTVQNTIIGNGSGSNYGVNVHSAVPSCGTFTFAYNLLKGDTAIQCPMKTGLRWIGNLGVHPGPCVGTFTRNVWQHTVNPNCGTTDKWVNGPAYSVSALGVDGDGRLTAGSPAIDAAETSGYCTSTLDSRDRQGTVRPRGVACDSGPHEY